MCRQVLKEAERVLGFLVILIFVFEPGKPFQGAVGSPAVHHAAAPEQYGVREQLPDLLPRLANRRDDGHLTKRNATAASIPAFSVGLPSILRTSDSITIYFRSDRSRSTGCTGYLVAYIGHITI